jgi:hypothetical protein
MPFNPFQEKGIPLDRQLRNWSELNVKPYDKYQTDPYTKCRVVVMNGIEVEAQFFSHQFARNTPDIEIKRQLAEVRRIEQQQQKVVNWLVPGTEDVLENTIIYEQVAVDLTAWVAQNEPDPYARQCYEFGVLEDFDHLYRYANLLDMLEGKKAEMLVGGYTEILPGRPTIFEHRAPSDEIRRPLAVAQAHPLSLLHALTITAAEQQTMNYYMNAGNRFIEPIARATYMEIAMIEEQHVSHYESLLDPTASWSENLLLHEYNEVYLYHSFMQQEDHPRIKQIWELHLAMELEHLRIAAELVRALDGKEPEMLVPPVLPQPVMFKENKRYLRQVLTQQVNLTSDKGEFVEVSQLPEDHDYFAYQAKVNSGGYVPSEQAVIQHSDLQGQDYRFATEGPLELRNDYPEMVRDKAGLEEVE